MAVAVPKKRGPLKRGYVHCHVLVPPHLAEWGKTCEVGLSELVRTLLQKEYERQQKRKPSPSS
jgi:hypothetical protein